MQSNTATYSLINISESPNFFNAYKYIYPISYNK